MRNEVYPSLLVKLIDSEKQRKIKRFRNLVSERREIYFDPLPDRLYADLNLTLTDRHLAMRMLEYLDERIAQRAREIMSDGSRSKRNRVEIIAQLVKNKRVEELLEASKRAAEDINIAKYITKDLEKLKPTTLVIFTDTPSITANVFKDLKLDPIYNARGKRLPIIIYATELEQYEGVLTGRVTYIPDEIERFKIQTETHLAFLEQNIHSIY
jgi:hypothetical protein